MLMIRMKHVVVNIKFNISKNMYKKDYFLKRKFDNHNPKIVFLLPSLQDIQEFIHALGKCNWFTDKK